MAKFNGQAADVRDQTAETLQIRPPFNSLSIALIHQFLFDETCGHLGFSQGASAEALMFARISSPQFHLRDVGVSSTSRRLQTMIVPKKLKLYLDTTIPSYVFALDSPERMETTRRFMRIGRQNHEMVISDVVMREIARAKEPKRTLLVEVVQELPILSSSAPSDALTEAYIQAGALPRGSVEDARHVAIATLHHVDALVSWNFGHLVNIRRRKAIADVNIYRGLPRIEILSPEEVNPS